MAITLDPFKQRCGTVRPEKRNLLLSKRRMNLILSHAQRLQDDEERIEQEELRLQKAEEAKQLRDAVTQRRRAGDTTRAQQHEAEVVNVRKDLEQETKNEARKKIVLNQAYKKLFEETDRVKYFKAAKNMAEMLKVRDEQMEAKTSLEDNMAKYDAQLFLGMLRDVERHHEELEEREKVKKENKKRNSASWLKQNSELLERKEKERWEHFKEGYRLRDEAGEENQKAIKEAEQKKHEIENYKKMLDKQIEGKLAMSEIQEQLDKAEETKAKLFNEAKREMILEHKNICDNLNKSRKSRRDYVAKHLISKSASTRAKEEANLRKAVRQANEKARDLGALKEAEMQQAKKDFEEFYQSKMAEKEKEKLEEKLEDFQEQRKMLEEVERLKNIEDSKIQKRQNLENEAQHMQLHQIAERRAKEKAEEVEELKDYMRHMRGLDEEEETFQKYVQIEIEDAEKRGINTFAMRKAGRPGIECGKGPLFKDRGYIRPRYYAATWNPTDLGHTEKKKNAVDTKTRLGFTM